MQTSKQLSNISRLHVTLYHFLQKKNQILNKTLKLKSSNLSEKNLTYQHKKVNGVWLWKLTCYWSVVWFEVEGILDLREIWGFLIENEEMTFCLALKQHAAWVNSHKFNTSMSLLPQGHFGLFSWEQAKNIG